MLKVISDKIAQGLGSQLQATDERIEVFSYGLQIIIGAAFKLTTIIALSLLFGIHKEAVAYLIFFILFRRYGGGVHLSTYPRCLIIGTAMIIGFAKLATINIPVYTLITLVILAFSLGCYCTIKWVPAGTEKKAVTDESSRSKQKTKVFIILIIWLFCITFLINSQLINYAFATTLGVISSLYLILPLGYKTLKSLDCFLNRIERRCKVC
jgi:accessory gene regulator B